MKLSSFDDDNENQSYSLRLNFKALEWLDLMNKFQLPFVVYAVLFCVIGASAVGTCLVCWAWVRFFVKRSKIPSFRFLECYEFMLAWPAQGVVIASVPICILLSIIKISFSPSFDLTRNIPCDFQLMDLPITTKAQEICRDGRTGMCFCIGGIMMLWSGSKMIIPKLREVEADFLIGRTTQQLNQEGLPFVQGNFRSIQDAPIRWKRCHLIWANMLLTIPLMIMWEFSYSNFFGESAVEFIVGFSFMMMYLEGVFAKTVREALLTVPMVSGCEVVLFIATMGAENFLDFTEGFFIELLFGIFDRLLLGAIIEKVYSVTASAKLWLQTRSWFWFLTIRVTSVIRKPFAFSKEKSADEDEDMRAEQENAVASAIEEAMEEHIKGGSSCMSMILSPFVIAAIWLYSDETQIPAMYDIRIGDLQYYLFFGIFIAPFQVMMDIFLNHSRELAQGVKIYDYMLYAKWRWRNRLTGWLFEDPRFDQSIHESVQSVNHLCFSPQYYFIATYYTWGVILLLLAVTTLLRAQMNPFSDPALPYFVFQQLVTNRILDKSIRAGSAFLWRPKDNAAARAFSHSVMRGLKQKEHEIQAHQFRVAFFERHKDWLMQNFRTVYTKQSLDRYKADLYTLYSRALNLKPLFQYKIPKLRPDETKPVIGAGGLPMEQETVVFDDEPPVVKISRPMLPVLPPAALPWPLMHAEPPPPLADDEDIPHDILPLSKVSVVAWAEMARRRVNLTNAAKALKKEATLHENCDKCGVHESSRESTWAPLGPHLCIYDDHDIRALMDEFEMRTDFQKKVETDLWVSWMKKHHVGATLCWRCAKMLDLKRTPPDSERDTATKSTSNERESTSNENDSYPEWLQVEIGA